jgi:hypothetical protein
MMVLGVMRRALRRERLNKGKEKESEDEDEDESMAMKKRIRNFLSVIFHDPHNPRANDFRVPKYFILETCIKISMQF